MDSKERRRERQRANERRWRARRRAEAAEQRRVIERRRQEAAEKQYPDLYALVRSSRFRAAWERVVGQPWDPDAESDPFRLVARVEAMIEAGALSPPVSS